MEIQVIDFGVETEPIEQPREIVVAQNRSLSSSLMGLRAQFRAAAEADLADVLSQDGSFTEMEKRAMVTIQELKLVNTMDLAAVYLRAQLIHEIEEGALWTVHPEHYATRNAMAQAQGISASELSDIMTLVDIIFPYLENTLGISVPTIWEQIGKSNFRDMVPTLRALITGETPESQNIANGVESLLNDVAATAFASGETLTGEQTRQHAISNLINLGGQVTNRELRHNVLRPTRTPPIPTVVVEYGTLKYILAEVDNDQYQSFLRKMGGGIDVATTQWPEDRAARQREARRVHFLRDLVGLE